MFSLSAILRVSGRWGLGSKGVGYDASGGAARKARIGVDGGEPAGGCARDFPRRRARQRSAGSGIMRSRSTTIFFEVFL